MSDAERLQIGHDGRRGVEIEIRRQLQRGRWRWGWRRHQRGSRRQNTDHGDMASPALAAPDRDAGGLGGMRGDRGRTGWPIRCSVAPSPRRQFAVSRPLSCGVRVAEARAGKPRHDLRAGESASSSRTSASRLRRPARVARFPVQHGGLEGRHVQRIRHVVAVFLIGPGEFPRRPLRTASARSPLKSQKNGNGTFDPHSSPMNSIGTVGASSVMASAASIASGVTMASSRSPSARLPIWSWFCRKLTKAAGGSSPLGSPRGLPAAMRRGLALIDEAGAQRARDVAHAAIV